MALCFKVHQELRNEKCALFFFQQGKKVGFFQKSIKKCVSRKIPALKNIRFCTKTSLCF